MVATQRADTKERLLEAGERLFAEHGIHRVRLRDLNELAGQRNSSALHYHFGSRMGLVTAMVDLTTAAVGWMPVPGPTTSGTFENSTAGRDFCGPNPDVTTGDVWTEQARSVARRPTPIERRITGTLTEISAVTIAADRAGLGGRDPSTLALTATDPVSITLTGLTPGAVVARGAKSVRVDERGTATIALQPGPNVVTIR